MKINLLIYLIAIFVSTSCTITKRTFNKGYHIEWYLKRKGGSVGESSIKVTDKGIGTCFEPKHDELILSEIHYDTIASEPKISTSVNFNSNNTTKLSVEKESLIREMTVCSTPFQELNQNENCSNSIQPKNPNNHTLPNVYFITGAILVLLSLVLFLIAITMEGWLGSLLLILLATFGGVIALGLLLIGLIILIIQNVNTKSQAKKNTTKPDFRKQGHKN